ncbi:MAG: ATP-dependent DNA helicase RecG [Clostridiales bacterium]|nr:ATP-dependent DNA helicase RecG [Clostridiales bacterium]
MPQALREIKGLGEKRIKALENAGIRELADFLDFLPLKYLDYTRLKRLSECSEGEEAVLRLALAGRPSQARVNGRMLTRASFFDGTDKISITWFNQPWMFKTLVNEPELLVYGRVETLRGARVLSQPRIVSEMVVTPVYRTIQGVPAKLVRELAELALDQTRVEETLPAALIERFDLMGRARAIRQAHFPDTTELLERALRRLKFEDMLCFMLNALMSKNSEASGAVIRKNEAGIARFLESLPYELTGAQKRVLDEILTDMASPKAMARLVQGDVGSGKTIVAFCAMYLAALSGWQSALMAPTEILASQHYQTALKVLEPLGVRCALLTGGTPAPAKKQIYEGLRCGEIQAVFGTHALISKGVEHCDLGLAITDEQHRFGVRQRTALGLKGNSPNVLVMSATPIPRTMALIMYGDLDISVIDELPPGRKPVKTRIVPESKREALYCFIMEEVRRGRQAYIVCPLVEESEETDAENATELYDELARTALKDARVALVHGKMKSEEKDKVLSDFAGGRTDVLVSTTVIEVGINVPNATVMVVEDAHRFGLAQLHQLRGRVGRGEEEAWCFLVSGETQRLKILSQTNDGFLIAEKDMELRGPGDIFGTRQSGAAGGLNADALKDTELLYQVHALAKEITSTHTPDAEKLKMTAQNWLRGKNEVVFSQN